MDDDRARRFVAHVAGVDVNSVISNLIQSQVLVRCVTPRGDASAIGEAPAREWSRLINEETGR